MVIMNTQKAFLLVTAAGYGFASVAALLGYPAMENVNPLIQAVGYAVQGVALAASAQYPGFKPLKYVLATVYGGLSVASFSGIQKWKDYAGGQPLQPAMALWDLAVGVAVLTNS